MKRTVNSKLDGQIGDNVAKRA